MQRSPRQPVILEDLSTHNKWISNGKKEAFKKIHLVVLLYVREKEEYAVMTTHCCAGAAFADVWKCEMRNV